MKKPFCCDANRSMYEDYYARQSGGEMPVFTGTRVQRGHGLGSIFANLKRLAIPLLKRGAKFLVPRLFKTGMEIADDVMEGKKFMDSAKQRVPGAAKEAMTGFTKEFVPEAIKEAMTRFPFQSGSGKRKKSISNRHFGVKRCKVARRKAVSRTLKKA